MKLIEKTGYPSIDKPWLKYYSEEAINAPLPEMDVSASSIDDTKDITKELKGILSSLVGEMIFNSELISRSSLQTPEENEMRFIEDIMEESVNGYTEEIIEKTRYYDPDAPENVFNI